MNTMRIKDSPTWKHHVETYGANFGYLDFIPVFNREVQKWDPNQWGFNRSREAGLGTSC